MRKTWTIFAIVAGLMSAGLDLHAQEAAMCACNLSGAPAAPPPDSLRLGVILVQFSDWATNVDARGSHCKLHETDNEYTYQHFYDQFFGANYRSPSVRTHDEDAVFGSMNEYFQEMSYGKFKLRANSDIINPHPNPNAPPQWATLRQTKSWWISQALNPQRLLDSTLAVSGFSTAGYDKIALIYAGKEAGGGLGPSAPFVGAFHYIIAEKNNGPRGRTNVVGTFYGIGLNCHEFGHLLGLPDLKGAPVRPAGLREFELMATGNQGFMDGNVSTT